MLYLQLFWEFFKTGLFAIGGGMATLPFLYDMADKTGGFTRAQLADMIQGYALKHTRALMDAFHMNIEEAQGARGLLDARDVLGHIHFADNNRLYPGGGCFDFQALAQSIREIGYDGMLSVECLPFPDGDEAARRACAFLHTFLK